MGFPAPFAVTTSSRTLEALCVWLCFFFFLSFPPQHMDSQLLFQTQLLLGYKLPKALNFLFPLLIFS